MLLWRSFFHAEKFQVFLYSEKMSVYICSQIPRAKFKKWFIFKCLIYLSIAIFKFFILILAQLFYNHNKFFVIHDLRLQLYNDLEDANQSNFVFFYFLGKWFLWHQKLLKARQNTNRSIFLFKSLFKETNNSIAAGRHKQ